MVVVITIAEIILYSGRPISQLGAPSFAYKFVILSSSSVLFVLVMTQQG